MREIRAEVSQSFVKLSSDRAGVRGESNAARVKLSFDESWDGLAKKVTWWDARGLGAVEVLLTADLLEDITASTRVYITTVPPEATRYAGRCTMVIDGCQGETRARSLSVGLEVSDAPIFNDPFIENDPTPSRAEQLQGEIDTLLEDMSGQAADALSYKEAAAAEALKAKNYYEEAVVAAGRAEDAAEQAEDTMSQPHVVSFKGRTGEVSPQAGDYTPQMVGADPAGSAAVKVSKAGDSMTGELKAPALSVGNRISYEGEDTGEMLTVGDNCFAAGAGALANGSYATAVYGNVYIVQETGTSSAYCHFGFYTTEKTYVPLPNDIVGKSVILIGKDGTANRAAKVINRWSASALRTERVEGRYEKVIVPIDRESLQGGEGLYSAHAEGLKTMALGETASHAEGMYTLAVGKGSHAEGSETVALGEGSHAEGDRCMANGKYSHAEGFGTIAGGDHQHVSGSWNANDTRYLVIVGNGYNDNNRSNAHTLDRSGNAWFSGNVTVGTQTQAANVPDPTAANQLAPKAYVDKTVTAAIQTATETFQGIITALETRVAALESGAGQ